MLAGDAGAAVLTLLTRCGAYHSHHFSCPRLTPPMTCEGALREGAFAPRKSSAAEGQHIQRQHIMLVLFIYFTWV